MSRRAGPTETPWVPISTKLQPPRPPADAVLRPRLLSRLDEGSRSRLLLLAAPAGYGKTLLASQWMGQSRAASAWLSIDAGDDDFESFFRYLVAAIERALPGSLPQSRALLEVPSSPPPDHVSAVLRAELGQVAEPLFLALDDYQSVTAPAVHELVRSLVEDLSENVRLIVLSRSDPALPLARWRGRGWLVDLRARDLRFSREECLAFFAVAEPSLSAADLESLAQVLEGWPAGLHLARLSLARAADPAAAARRFTGSDRLIVEYLVEEVLSAQPPEMRRFLAATAPLGRFCAPLCERVLPRDGPRRSAAELLAEARREGLFVVSLDAEGNWFRYHHLFAQLLGRHLPEAASRKSQHEVARRAAEWFAEEGLIEEALRLWIAAGEVDAAATLLGRQLDEVLDRHDGLRLLGRFLALFPAGAEDGRLPLLVARCHEKFSRWDLAGIRATVELAEAALGPQVAAGTADFRADLDALRCFLAYWQGDSDAAIRHGDQALATAGIERRRWVRSLASTYRAGGLQIAGRLGEALRFMARQSLDDDVRSGPHFGRYLIVPGLMHLYANELSAAQDAAKRVISAADTVEISEYWLGEAEYLLGSIALERDRLEEAETFFRRVQQRKYHVLSRIFHDSLIGLALVAERRGDLAGRDEWAARARAWALEAGDPGSIILTDSFESRGSPGSLEVVASDPALSRLVEAASLWLEVPSVTACERLLLDPDPEVRRAALPEIDAAMARFEARNNDRQALRLAVVRADALAHAGRRNEALKLLAKLLRRAVPEGIVRPFLRGGLQRRELLATLGSRGPYRSFVERVLSSPAAVDGASPAAAPAAAAAPELDPLTLREQEVLDLLAERLTNKEIAAQLGIKSETVKKRLLSIYSKLDVHGRREAVAVAMARGLIERRPR